MTTSRFRLCAAAPEVAGCRIARALFGGADAGAGSNAGPPLAGTVGGGVVRAPGIKSAAQDGLTDFQAEAALRATEIMARRGGVLIADGVGLGKTHIAAALVEARLRAGARVVVVAPSSLRRPWLDVLRRAARRAGADAVGSGRVAGRSRVWWVSHARLSRGRWPNLVAVDAGLVVVDEAHAFRNPRTLRYRALARLCRDADVALLTATPVNNTLLDLYHQLRLFATDRTFVDLGVPALEAVFREAAAAGAGPDGSPNAGTASATGALHAVLRAVMIRRTRPLLRERGARLPGGKSFPARAPAVPLRYAFSDGAVRSADPLAELETIEFAFTRIHGRSGAAELLEIVLLKRLESSVAAFSASLRSLIRYHDALAAALADGRLLSAAEHRSLVGGADQLLLAPLVLRAAPRAIDAQALLRRVEADADRLRRLSAALSGPRPDPKLEVLCRLLRSLDGERVLVFTEFRETALYLWRSLRREHRVGLVHGGGAALGAGVAGRRAVIERFAPVANGARPPAPHEAVDVLIATDVLSEGLNLQDAAHVVSYDLPWNPVRLIQRVGRIDRLGSPHAIVHSYCFVPDAGLDRLLLLMDRLRAKLAAIRCAAGRSAAQSAPHAAPPFVERLARGDATVLDEIEQVDAAPWEAEERLRAQLQRCTPAAGVATIGATVLAKAGADTDSASTGATPNAVPVAVVSSGLPALGGVLVAVRVERADAGGTTVRLAFVRRSGQVTLDEPAAFELIRSALVTAAKPPAIPRRAVAIALRRARRAVWRAEAAPDRVAGTFGPFAARAAGRAGPADRTTRDVARLLLRVVPAAGGAVGTDDRLCRRTDDCLARLSHGVSAGAEIALRDMLDRYASKAVGDQVACADRLISEVETALGRRRSSDRSDRLVRVTPLAILVAAM